MGGRKQHTQRCQAWQAQAAAASEWGCAGGEGNYAPSRSRRASANTMAYACSRQSVVFIRGACRACELCLRHTVRINPGFASRGMAWPTAPTAPGTAARLPCLHLDLSARRKPRLPRSLICPPSRISQITAVYTRQACALLLLPNALAQHQTAAACVHCQVLTQTHHDSPRLTTTTCTCAIHSYSAMQTLKHTRI